MRTKEMNICTATEGKGVTRRDGFGRGEGMVGHHVRGGREISASVSARNNVYMSIEDDQ